MHGNSTHLKPLRNIDSICLQKPISACIHHLQPCTQAVLQYCGHGEAQDNRAGGCCNLQQSLHKGATRNILQWHFISAAISKSELGGPCCILHMHDWMHHFHRPRFLSPANKGQPSATAQDAPAPSATAPDAPDSPGHQTLAEQVWGGCVPTQADLPSVQVPL